jgi:hypothetical protein
MKRCLLFEKKMSFFANRIVVLRNRRSSGFEKQTMKVFEKQKV